jgi:hypothetical protein
MGPDPVTMPLGGIGVITLGRTRWSTSIDFVDIPVGQYIPRYDGYGTTRLDVADLGPIEAFCEIESGVASRPVKVTRHGRARAEINVAPSRGCRRVGFDRVVANAAYELDPEDHWAGSIEGDNIVAVYLDGAGAGSPVEIRLCGPELVQDCAQSPFGIFAELPDPQATRWPDPSEWQTEALTIPADGHGDLVAYLVVEPGAVATQWKVRVQYDLDFEIVSLRISGANTVTIVAP